MFITKQFEYELFALAHFPNKKRVWSTLVHTKCIAASNGFSASRKIGQKIIITRLVHILGFDQRKFDRPRAVCERARSVIDGLKGFDSRVFCGHCWTLLVAVAMHSGWQWPRKK